VDLTGQAEAIQLGIARLLCKMDKENRPILKPFGFLTRDSRIKERKKYGLRKAEKLHNIQNVNFYKICQNLIYILHGLKIHQLYVMENHFV
jgi:hypothetical protein